MICLLCVGLCLDFYYLFSIYILYLFYVLCALVVYNVVDLCYMFNYLSILVVLRLICVYCMYILFLCFYYFVLCMFICLLFVSSTAHFALQLEVLSDDTFSFITLLRINYTSTNMCLLSLGDWLFCLSFLMYQKET